MGPFQRLPDSLTPLDVALAGLMRDLAEVAPVERPLSEALGAVAAAMPPLRAFPPRATAIADGWALQSRDLTGASSYSPLPLAQAPIWVEAGEAVPPGCDCVIDGDAVDRSGPMVQVLAEAIPGQGVRRIGGDIPDGAVAAAGRCIGLLDLLLARAAGLERLSVRRPRLRLVNVPAASGQAMSTMVILESARQAGADVTVAEAAGRDPSSIAREIVADGSDLVIVIGGSGVGRRDATVTALAGCGELITHVTHGVALQPGRSAAFGRIGKTPIVVLPGAPDQALAGWWTLARPMLDRLSGRQPRQPIRRLLLRKIASSVGIAELVVLERREDAWMPLAVGDLPLELLARAEAWLVVPGGSEGYAAGTPVDAYMLRD